MSAEDTLMDLRSTAALENLELVKENHNLTEQLANAKRTIVNYREASRYRMGGHPELDLSGIPDEDTKLDVVDLWARFGLTDLLTAKQIETLWSRFSATHAAVWLIPSTSTYRQFVEWMGTEALQLATLAPLAISVAKDVIIYAKHDYNYPDIHPARRHKYERDVEEAVDLLRLCREEEAAAAAHALLPKEEA